MSTIQDFENAPVGATAKKEDGLVVIREGDETDHRPWMCTTYGDWFSNEELAERGYTLNPTAPTNSREALDLAWELGHEVKIGQAIPAGTRYLEFPNSEVREYTAPIDLIISPALASKVRTHESLPDPEPDWLDAPAVLAHTYNDNTRRVWTAWGDGRWASTGLTYTLLWQNLRDVTPLYPKEGQEA